VHKEITIKIVNPGKIQRSIDVLQKAIDGKPINTRDEILIIDVQGILRGLKRAYKVQYGGEGE